MSTSTSHLKFVKRCITVYRLASFRVAETNPFINRKVALVKEDSKKQ